MPDPVGNLVSRYEVHRIDPITGVHVFRNGPSMRYLSLGAGLLFFVYAVQRIFTFVVHRSSQPVWDLGSIVIGLLLAISFWRISRMEVRVTPDGIVVRNPYKTFRIPANDVRSIDLGRKARGDVGEGGHVWLAYIQRVNGSSVCMGPIRGGGAPTPSREMLANVNEIRRLLGVHGVDFCRRTAIQYSRVKRKS